MNKNFGLSEKDFALLKNKLVNFLKDKENFKIYVFGSRGKGTERKYSDIDLWIESNPSLTAQEIANFLHDIEESDLTIKIDLVTPDTCLNEYKARILNERVEWLKG